MSGRITHAALRALDRVNRALLPKPKKAEHLQTGKKGEEEAYFYLRKLGYVMVARNWRSPRRKGELDLVGWDGDCLCFVEVKTRTTKDVAPAEAAVDADKQQELEAMAQEFVRRLLLTSRAGRGNPTDGEALPAGRSVAAGGPDLSAWQRLVARLGGADRAAALGSECPQPAPDDAHPKIRFDVLSIYYLEAPENPPQFALFKNCFPMS